MGRAALRLKGIRRVQKHNIKAARGLHRTGFVPQATYHSAVHGVSPSTLAKWRAALSVSSGLGGAARCTTMSIALSAGFPSDPA
eukprot:13675266-Alexandrium_andersonii.AAC.1